MTTAKLLSASSGILDILADSAVGIIIVFAVLLVLMFVIFALSAAMRKKKAEAKNAPIVAPAPTAAPEISGTPAKGSCGGVVLNGIDERTAAMLMAIVADELKLPLCELRFISVKEI